MRLAKADGDGTCELGGSCSREDKEQHIGGQSQVREGEEVEKVKGSKGICCIPQDVGWMRMYLTFWALSSFDQDRVDGNEGRDEEVVTKGPLSV